MVCECFYRGIGQSSFKVSDQALLNEPLILLPTQCCFQNVVDIVATALPTRLANNIVRTISAHGMRSLCIFRDLINGRGKFIRG